MVSQRSINLISPGCACICCGTWHDKAKRIQESGSCSDQQRWTVHPLATSYLSSQDLFFPDQTRISFFIWHFDGFCFHCSERSFALYKLKIVILGFYVELSVGSLLANGIQFVWFWNIYLIIAKDKGTCHHMFGQINVHSMARYYK